MQLIGGPLSRDSWRGVVVLVVTWVGVLNQLQSGWRGDYCQREVIMNLVRNCLFWKCGHETEMIGDNILECVRNQRTWRNPADTRRTWKTQ